MRNAWRVVIGLLAVALLGVAGVPINAATTARPAGAASTCKLGNGVEHVISIVFDNVHFFRDNPNVPSDLELIRT